MTQVQKTEYPQAPRVNQTQLMAMLRYCFERKRPVIIMGDSGSGKSFIPRAVAESMGMSFKDILRPSTTNPVDACGVPVPDHDKKITEWFTPDYMPNAKRDGKRGVAMVDEFNSGPRSNQAMGYGLLLDRVLGAWRAADVAPEWTFVFCGNLPGSSNAIADKLSAALADRATVVVLVGQFESWDTNFAIPNNIHPLIRGFLKTRPDAMRGSPMDTIFATERSWTDGVHPFMDLFDSDRETWRVIVSGSLGVTLTAEFEAFCELATKAPAIADIIADPSGTWIPDDLAICYALSCALSAIADSNNFDSVLAYIARVSGELLEYVIHAATTRDESLKNTAAYVARCLGDSANRGVAS